MDVLCCRCSCLAVPKTHRSAPSHRLCGWFWTEHSRLWHSASSYSKSLISMMNVWIAQVELHPDLQIGYHFVTAFSLKLIKINEILKFHSLQLAGADRKHNKPSAHADWRRCAKTKTTIIHAVTLGWARDSWRHGQRSALEKNLVLVFPLRPRWSAADKKSYPFYFTFLLIHVNNENKFCVHNEDISCW